MDEDVRPFTEISRPSFDEVKSQMITVVGGTPKG